jgi:hypothetical protein
MFANQNQRNRIIQRINESDNFSDDGNISPNRYRNIRLNETNSPLLLPNSPPPISLEQIEQITNKKQLLELEKTYDEFLEKKCQLLLLYDIIDEYLEIRDKITIKILKMDREEMVKRLRTEYIIESTPINYSQFESINEEE